MAKEEGIVLKILLVGDSNVGKSSLLLRFTDGQFSEDPQPTIGVDFKIKTMNVNGKKVKLTIWDTAGQERFRTLTSSYYRGAHGIILVYDVSRKETYDHIKTWKEEVDLYATHPDTVQMVVGNKTDVPAEDRQIERKDGENFARSLSTLFIECSAKDSTGVQQAFEELVYKIMDTPSLVQSAKPNIAGIQVSADTSAEGAEGGCGC